MPPTCIPSAGSTAARRAPDSCCTPAPPWSGLHPTCWRFPGGESCESPSLEEHDMTERKVWLITGAGRGLGVDIAKAVLAAGHAVVATGRDAARVVAAIGDRANLLAATLDVTRPQDAQAAVEAAVAKFGRIDVVVNNAGNFFAGFFEELSPEQVRNQIETLLFGPMNVTRA